MHHIFKKGASKEEIEQLNKELFQIGNKKPLDAQKYCGIIKLDEDPMVIQKSLRNEWR